MLAATHIPVADELAFLCLSVDLVALCALLLLDIPGSTRHRSRSVGA